MIKKSLYPKTPRVKVMGEKVHLTEKLDGSNLVFFKKDGELYIGCRNNIYTLAEIEEVKDKLYKGLYAWLKDNGEVLKNSLMENSAICGEWMGMGSIKYDIGDFDKRWYMFAKANIDADFNLFNLKYDHSLFIYPFVDGVIPSFLGIVPEVCETSVLPNKEHLDSIYAKYCAKVGRPVEGFVINYLDNICKYVRMKSGKLVEYSENDHKNN